jgi:hypothetical protein
MSRRFNTQSRRPRPASAPVEDGLRGELQHLFYGDSQTPGKSFKIMVLKADKRQRAHDFDPLKREAGAKNDVRRGSVWPQYSKFISVVKSKFVGKEEESDMGFFDYNTSLFFFEHDAGITEEDELIEVRTNDLGEPVDPIEYLEKYTIKDVDPLRFESGRVEFLKVYASKSQ